MLKTFLAAGLAVVDAAAQSCPEAKAAVLSISGADHQGKKRKIKTKSSGLQSGKSSLKPVVFQDVLIVFTDAAAGRYAYAYEQPCSSETRRAKASGNVAGTLGCLHYFRQPVDFHYRSRKYKFLRQAFFSLAYFTWRKRFSAQNSL